MATEEYERFFEAGTETRYVASRLGTVGQRATVSRDRRAKKRSPNYYRGQWRYDFSFKTEVCESFAAACERAEALANEDDAAARPAERS